MKLRPLLQGSKSRLSLMVPRAFCGGSSRSSFSPLLSPCPTETLHPVPLFSFLQASLHPVPSILTSLHDQDSVLCRSSHLPILCSVPAFGGSVTWPGSAGSPSLLPGPDNFPTEPEASPPCRPPGWCRADSSPPLQTAPHLVLPREHPTE